MLPESKGIGLNCPKEAHICCQKCVKSSECIKSGRFYQNKDFMLHCCGECENFERCNGRKAGTGQAGVTKAQENHHLMPEFAFIDTGLHSQWADLMRRGRGLSEDEMTELLKETYANAKNETYEVAEHIKLKALKSVKKFTIADSTIKLKFKESDNKYTNEEIEKIQKKYKRPIVVESEQLQLTLGKLRFKKREE